MRRGRTNTSSGLADVRATIAKVAIAAIVAMSAGCAVSVNADEPTLPVLSAASGLQAVPGARLCVTSGWVDSLEAPNLKVDVGAMRGVVAGDRSGAAELAFTYPGPSHVEAPLADGEVRRQIGLKLRAQDTCNVVYVMWRIAPVAGVFVQVKSNPGKSTHEECGDRGYTELPATVDAQPAPILPGERHTLRADLEGNVLTVHADGVVAWKGALPAEVAALDGPVGMRSDNGQFDFELRVPGGARPGPRCRSGQPASIL